MQENKVNVPAKTILALILGNALEWYDFVIYSFLTVYIAKLFFPYHDSAYSFLAATATFGAAFVTRPLGGLVFGFYADRYGRKSAITAVMMIMATAILLICFTPTYAQIGITAPLLIVLARLLQGFSAGGEFGASTSFLIEMAPRHLTGFYGSLQMVGQVSCMLLGSAMILLVSNLFSEDQMYAWGWRIPFAVGLLITPIIFYLRRRLNTQALNSHDDHEKIISLPVFISRLKAHLSQVLITMGLVIGGTVSSYANLTYMPTFAIQQLHLPSNETYMVLVICSSLMVSLIPFFGWLSDKIGRKPILLISTTVYLFSIYPLFYWLIHSPSVINLMIVLLIVCSLLGAFYGVFATIVAELFPMQIRSTALSLSYNLAVMFFGGFAQFIVTWLLKVTGSPQAISYYLLFTLTVTFIAALCYQEKGIAEYA